ncbi:MAG: PatB family C-S lyase [Bacteroidaceae bacterium]|nr:PatB family C-S lyase [Bacteroidaceae bacterium]
MKYNFDALIDRRGTGAIKVDCVQEYWGRDDLLPMWIADMDFPTAPFVVEAIKKRLENPILGYTHRCDSWYKAVVDWQQMRYGWSVRKEWLNFVSGIVPGIAHCLQAFTEPGDKILIQTPVYHPYILVPQKSGRELVMSDLIVPANDVLRGFGKHGDEANFQIDWARFERDLEGCKLFLLCHPHNPGGRVWTREELFRMAEICARKQVIVVSDEIHADLTLKPYHHIPFASVSETAAQNSITLASPSKAFNMPGLSSSISIIPNEAIAARFNAWLESGEFNLGHLFAFDTVTAAYSNGTEWLEQCLDYIQGNIDYVEQTLRREMPRIGMIRPQASYLVFLDGRGLELTVEELNRFFTDEAHLALNDGAMFGKPGEGFMRLNVASPRSTIAQAMNQLKAAYQKRFGIVG